MKTPIQDFIEWLENYPTEVPTIHKSAVLAKANKILEKEKEVMCEFQDKAQYKDFWVKYDGSDDCFEQTFNTKER
jgi:hypothetical protein